MSRLLLFISLFILTISAHAQNLKVNKLFCEYQTNPAGIETLAPDLSWKAESSERNVAQSAYHILVSDNPVSLSQDKGEIWNSNKVNSSQSIHIQYAGRPLLTGKTYYWKVKIWDSKNQSSSWSSINTWQMGLLKKADWKAAKWIAYEKLPDSNVNILPTDGKKDKVNTNNILPVLRKDFTLKKQVKKATMFISGLGHFELYVNGEKIGDHFLDPGWTKYDKEALYVAFDLTKNLKSGGNTLGVMLGNGFYYVPPVKNRFRKLKVAFGYPKVISRLVIEYTDGTSSDVVSDASWKTSPSAITFSSIYGGEDYNANLDQKGWNSFGFDAGKWKKVLVVDGPKLTAQKAAPIKIFDHFKPKSIKKNAAGNYVYDLGQNASGIIELRVRGKKGDTVRVIPAELLKADGSVNQKPTGSPYYFQYILKGSGTEIWRPRFSYYGFRYLEVKNAVPGTDKNTNSAPVITSLEGLHVRNAAADAGTFTSSNDLFNKTDQLIDWSIKSNMVSVFTDCPHREKLGWLEQVHLMGSSLRYNYDVVTLFHKSLQDMRASQTSEGLVPEIAPEYVKFEWGGDMFRDSPEWGSSSIILPWYLYEWYGDKKSLVEYYPMMQKYINYLGTKSKNHILSQGLGDWYDLGPNPPGVSQLTPMGITGTAIYYYDLTIMERASRLIGKDAEANEYKDLASKVKIAFNTAFFDKETNQYGSGSQTANAMAVFMELVDPANKDAVVKNLIDDLKASKNSLTAGDIGFRYLLRVLENEGRSDVIFDMNSRSDVPGYGYQLAKGATALTESWAALPTVSNNHLMLGHLMEWFYSGVGGIRQEDNSIAFSNIRIYPEIVGDLTSASTSYESPYGLISTAWMKTADMFEIKVTVPVNTKATIYIPASKQQTIKEGNTPIENNPQIQIKGFEKGRAMLQVGSGTYKFNVQ
jgi:alpha-L-rhamnosidase